MSEQADAGDTTHATCVAIEGRAVLLVGGSGTGKSATALEMIALGAALVSDDRVALSKDGARLMAGGIEGYEGMIEARGIGILKTECRPMAEVAYIVDMEQTELHRLPPRRTRSLMDHEIPVIFGRDNPVLPAALIALLRGGRVK